MIVKVCAERGCGQYIRYGQRCLLHQRQRNAVMRERLSYLYAAPGYRARARRQREQYPYCAWCGSQTDLTAQHVDAHDPESALITLCRGCNTRDANARRPGVGV